MTRIEVNNIMDIRVEADGVFVLMIFFVEYMTVPSREGPNSGKHSLMATKYQQHNTRRIRSDHPQSICVWVIEVQPILRSCICFLSTLFWRVRTCKLGSDIPFGTEEDLNSTTLLMSMNLGVEQNRVFVSMVFLLGTWRIL